MKLSKYYLVQILLTINLVLSAVVLITSFASGEWNMKLFFIASLFYFIALLLNQFMLRTPPTEEIQQRLREERAYCVLQKVNVFFSRLMAVFCFAALLYLIFFQK